MTEDIVKRISEQASQFYIDNHQKFCGPLSAPKEILLIQTAMLIGASIALEQQTKPATDWMDTMLEELFNQSKPKEVEGWSGCRGGMSRDGQCPL